MQAKTRLRPCEGRGWICTVAPRHRMVLTALFTFPLQRLLACGSTRPCPHCVATANCTGTPRSDHWLVWFLWTYYAYGFGQVCKEGFHPPPTPDQLRSIQHVCKCNERYHPPHPKKTRFPPRPWYRHKQKQRREVAGKIDHVQTSGNASTTHWDGFVPLLKRWYLFFVVLWDDRLLLYSCAGAMKRLPGTNSQNQLKHSIQVPN